MAGKKFCCDYMAKTINNVCEQHEDRFDCPDSLVFHDEKLDEYGLIVFDGSYSYIEISYCPWCGAKLPGSKRDLWFDKLEELGFDNPMEQDIPEEFRTGKWITGI